MVEHTRYTQYRTHYTDTRCGYALHIAVQSWWIASRNAQCTVACLHRPEAMHFCALHSKAGLPRRQAASAMRPCADGTVAACPAEPGAHMQAAGTSDLHGPPSSWRNAMAQSKVREKNAK